MPICQNGNVWQEYIHFDKLQSKHSQGGCGKAGGGARRSTATLLILSAGDPQGCRAGSPGRAGAATPFGTAAPPLPTGAATAARHSRRSSTFSFLTFKIGGKGLKRELGAHCWGQAPGSEEGTANTWAVPKASPALRSDEPVGGLAGQSPLDKDHPPASLAAQAVEDNKYSDAIF